MIFVWPFKYQINLFPSRSSETNRSKSRGFSGFFSLPLRNLGGSNIIVQCHDQKIRSLVTPKDRQYYPEVFK